MKDAQWTCIRAAFFCMIVACVLVCLGGHHSVRLFVYLGAIWTCLTGLLAVCDEIDCELAGRAFRSKDSYIQATGKLPDWLMWLLSWKYGIDYLSLKKSVLAARELSE